MLKNPITLQLLLFQLWREPVFLNSLVIFKPPKGTYQNRRYINYKEDLCHRSCEMYNAFLHQNTGL